MLVKSHGIYIEKSVSCMQKYIELLIKSWVFLNGRKKEVPAVPVFMIAVAGFLQAAACWIIAQFFFYFFSDTTMVGNQSVPLGISFGVALVATLAIIGFTVWVDRGRNLSALTWFGDFLEKWQEKYYESSNISRHYNILLINGVLVCKILCMAALISEGYIFWVLYAYALSYCAFASAISKTGKLEGGESADVEAYTVCGILLIVTCILHSHLIPVVIALAGSYFVTRFIVQLFIKKFESINEELVRSVSEIVLCLLLIAGLLLIK
jgi:hypothetical protein